MSDTKMKQRPMISIEEVKESFEKIVANNGYKKGTKEFRTAECSFLQGVMVADNRHAEHPYFVMCIIAGRSILDN